MQARNEAIGNIFVDDEREVEVVRRLRNQMHAQRTEFGQHRRHAMQHRAHATPDQRDRGARRNHFDAADARQIGAQCGQHIGVDKILGRIERHRDVGFRRTHQIDRQAVPLEMFEDVREESHLLPHADGFHRDQRESVARADRLDARRGVDDGGGDFRSAQLRAVRVADRQRYARFAHRIDTARMQHLRAGRRDFLRFLIVQPRQQPRVRDVARVRAEHAGDVRPDFHFFRSQQCAEITGRRIRTAAPEDDGFSGVVARDEALRDEQIAALRQRLRHRRVVCRRHRGGKIAAPRILIRHRLRVQMFARIEPMRGDPDRSQIGDAERARHQLAQRKNLRLPRQRNGIGTRVCDQR